MTISAVAITSLAFFLGAAVFVFDDWKRVRDSRLGRWGIVALFLTPALIPMIIIVLSAMGIMRVSGISRMGGDTGLLEVVLKLPDPSILTSVLAYLLAVLSFALLLPASVVIGIGFRAARKAKMEP